MKTAAYFKSFAAAVLFASVLASCSKDIMSDDRPSDIYTFTLSADGTKAVLAEDERGRYGHWEAGDRLGTVVASDAPAYSNITVGTPSSFNIYRPGGLQAGELLYVYYPYNNSTPSAHEVRFEIPPSQSQNGTEFDFDAMPLAAAPFEIPAMYAGSSQQTPIGGIHLYNLAAVAEFRVYSSNPSFRSETIQSVRFQATAPVAGPFTKDITTIIPDDEESLAISGYSATIIETAVASAPAIAASGDVAASVFMVLAPGSYDGTVTVVTDMARYSFPLKSSQTFRRSVVRGFDVDLGSCQNRESTAATTTVSKTIVEMLNGAGITPENGVKYEVLRLDDVITVETNGYNNCGKFYNSGKNWRIYAADYGNIKIKAAPGYELQSVTLTYTVNKGTGSVVPSFDGPASGTAQTVSGCSVTWHVGNKLGNLAFTKVSVTYVYSGFVPGRGFLDCNEMPAVESVVATATGNETFGDDENGTSVWHEFDLPDPDLKVVTHTFLYNGRKLRNYTTMVDKNRRCALWVACPMHGVTYIDNNIGRTGKFDEKTSYDPAIPASWQSSGSTEGGSSGYDRGHLCASNDRQTTYGANCQTFYFTNQVPQWANSFNSGVWSSLEGAVQSKAASLTARDTLYVVSGTLFEDGDSGPSNDGGTVARPSHMYKLLMLCSFDSSGTMTAARSAAYIYENKAHTGKNYSDAAYKTTIDAIEQRTGFNFFAAVPSGLQETAESQFNNIL